MLDLWLKLHFQQLVTPLHWDHLAEYISVYYPRIHQTNRERNYRKNPRGQNGSSPSSVFGYLHSSRFQTLKSSASSGWPWRPIGGRVLLRKRTNAPDRECNSARFPFSDIYRCYRGKSRESWSCSRSDNPVPSVLILMVQWFIMWGTDENRSIQFVLCTAIINCLSAFLLPRFWK